MKKLLCVLAIFCAVFVFTLTSCKKGPNKIEVCKTACAKTLKDCEDKAKKDAAAKKVCVTASEACLALCK